jgi:hypothetical protein
MPVSERAEVISAVDEYLPEEEARTTLGMAQAMARGDVEGARHLWDMSERPDHVAMSLAVMLANSIQAFSTQTGDSIEHFYAGMQQAIEENCGTSG